MKIIIPVTVDDSVLTYTNIGETDFAVWSSGVTYSSGQKCILPSTHKIYQSATNNNLNKNPATNPADWIAIAPTNAWAAFDGVVGTATVAPSISFELTTNSLANGLALLDVVCSQVVVTVYVAGSAVYTKTYRMSSDANTADWYSYFFTPQTPKRTLLITDLPRYSNSKVRVDITRTEGNCSLGLCALGQVEDLGITNYGCSIGITDYSKKTVDDFGNYTIAKRAFSKRMKATLELDNTRLDRVFSVLSDVRSTPLVFAGTDIYDATCLYGFYKDFDITIQYATTSVCNIEIEGLV